MKSHYKYYVAGWVIFVTLFNIIVFAIPNEIAGHSKFTGGFWLGYIFIMIVFVLHLGTALYALKGGIEKMLFHVPLLGISCGSLIAIMIVGTLCMIVSAIPVWLGIILCFCVMGISIIMMLKADMVGDIASDIDTKTKAKTIFIKALTVDMDSLLAKSVSDEMSGELKKVYEAIRYSDPMSSEALSSVENSILVKFDELSVMVKEEDTEGVKIIAKEMLTLLNDRNKKCKLLK